VCHALTANSDVTNWWNGIFGKGDYFDKDEYFIVCANILGSCYGTTGPLSDNASGKPYLMDFPLVTPRDMANAHFLLKVHLEIQVIDLLIGSSLGGQQAMEFAIQLKEDLDQLILIATNAKHSPYGIAFNESQRLALLADESFERQEPNGGEKGLIAARSIAMLSYRSYHGYQITQSEENSNKLDDFKSSSYQRYQGKKLAKRFNAYSYWVLLKSMDSHHVGRNKPSMEDALAEITARTLVVGISSDLLFPVEEQKYLAEHIPNAQLEVMDSNFGHDGFLADAKVLETIIIEFLKTI
jgi:homoserine O-acetyltransferase/O-succinyltransferase